MSDHDGGGMDAADREKMGHDIQAATERLRRGEVDSVDVATPQGVTRISRDPANPHSMRVEVLDEHGSPTMTSLSYPAAPARPATYPQALPFVRDCTAMVTVAAGKDLRMAVWMKPADPDAAFGEARRQAVEIGWEERPSMPMIQTVRRVREVVYERGGREASLRQVTFGDIAQVIWTEGGRTEGDDPADRKER